MGSVEVYEENPAIFKYILGKEEIYRRIKI
jgi:hypothetical protein